MPFFDSNPAGRILNRFSKDQDEGMYQLFYQLDTIQVLRYLLYFVISVCLSVEMFVFGNLCSPFRVSLIFHKFVLKCDLT